MDTTEIDEAEETLEAVNAFHEIFRIARVSETDRAFVGIFRITSHQAREENEVNREIF